MTSPVFSRRVVLALLSAQAVVGLAAPAAAQTLPPEQQLIERLRASGYTTIEARRTFLGRIRIEAAHPDGTEREIVLNPRTGEILRDYMEIPDEDEEDHAEDAEDDDDREDDEDEDKDEDDEEDDNDGDDDSDDDDDGGDDD